MFAVVKVEYWRVEVGRTKKREDSSDLPFRMPRPWDHLESPDQPVSATLTSRPSHENQKRVVFFGFPQDSDLPLTSSPRNHIDGT